MTSVKYLIWDFDGTLGYREGLTWSAVLRETLDQRMPGHPFAAEQLAPHLRSGFPWHMPERPHTHITSADQWWAELGPVFERAYLALGLSPADACTLAGNVRRVYCNPARFRLFDDTLPTLDALSARGWTHIVLSNHVPEFDEIAEALALWPRVAAIFNSARIGYEKPHPQIFREAMAVIGNSGPVWMIGDNYSADILGAAAAGIPGVLVRKPHESAQRYCSDLTQVAAMLEAAS